jgi:hypothetical protein
VSDHDDLFAPWLTDPDDPADVPATDAGAAARKAAEMFPELVDKGNDGPLRQAADDFVAAIAKAIGRLPPPAAEPGHDPYIKHIIRTFMEAVNHLDESEPMIRDLIENELMDVAGVDRTKVGAAIAAGTNLAKKIAAIRQQHIKRAFRHLRDRLPRDI